MGNRAGAVMAGAVLVLCLGGCSAADTPKSAVTHTPSSSATPTASPTKQVTTKPALADLVLTADGLGYVRIGKPVLSRPDAMAIVAYNPTACVSGPDGVKAGQPGAGAWMSTYPGSFLNNFDVVTADPTQSGIVTSIDAFTSEISTNRGIHAGSTISQVEAAYPKFDQSLDAGTSEVYVNEGKLGQLLIEVSKDDPTLPGYWQPGQTGRVLWIRSIGLDQDPYAINGTDSSGPCPP